MRVFRSFGGDFEAAGEGFDVFSSAARCFCEAFAVDMEVAIAEG